MRKILIGHGPKSEQVNGILHFNWTGEKEPVNVDGIVCCTSPACGCTRSFTGIRSRNTTTRGIVIEIEDRSYTELLLEIHEITVASMRRMKHIKPDAANAVADYRVECFRDVSEKLIAGEPLGTVLTVEKDQKSKYQLYHLADETILTRHC